MKIFLRRLILILFVFHFFPPLNAEVFQDVTVRQGDTLWSISQYYLKDPKRWPDILKYNPSLGKDPMVALPGMRLRIPVLLIKESLRAAELLRLINDVRYKRQESSSWQTAKLEMQLFNGDSLRTLSDSNADVKFPTGEVIKLEANSYAVIRPEKTRETVELLAGDMRAKQARVITASGANIAPQGKDSDFRTRVKADRSELVLVYKGRVDVTAQGKTVAVLEGFGTEIKPMAAPAEPVSLPQIPDVALGDLPSLGDVTVKPGRADIGPVLSVDPPSSKDLKVQASFPGETKAQAVRPRNLVDKYHLEIADSQDFKRPLMSKYYPLSEKINFRSLGLKSGVYWWRIAYVDSLGMEGGFSRPQSIDIDLTPPDCTLVSPSDGEEFDVDEEYVEVRGHAEPNVRITINDEPATVDFNGSFSVRVPVHAGKTRLIAKAIDRDGNATTLERVVYRLAEGQKGRTMVAKSQMPDDLPEESKKGGFFASATAGLLTIGTIIGVFLLILG